MTIKKLLLPLLDTPADESAILHAVEFARPLGAHVTAMFSGGYLSELVPVEAVPDRRVNPRLQVEARAQLRALTEAARDAFVSLVAKHGLTVTNAPDGLAGGTVSFEAWRGTLDAAIQEAAVLHDLVIFHRDDGNLPADSTGFTTMKSALQNCGRPILISTGSLDNACGSHVAIAWNGSIEGAHAVSAAIPILATARTVHVLTIVTQKTSGDQARKLQEYLSWHGIQSEIHTSKAGAESVGTALLGMVDAVGADLFVLGGYTHGRIRQTILGGVTHVVVEQARVSALLSQ